jgi:DNA-binding transcriptional LysR family regulator
MIRHDLTTLRLFLSVYQEQNMARAADREHIAASAISKRMAELEILVGTPLFTRLQAGVRPTTAADELARHVQTIMQTLDKIGADLSRYAAGHKGEVTICCNTTSLVSFLGEEVFEYSQANPDVTVTLDERSSTNVVRALVDGVADIGVINGTIDKQGLSVIHSRYTRLMLVMPKGHELAELEAISFPQAARFNFVSLRESIYLGRLVDPEFLESSPHFNLRLKPMTYEAIRQLVEMGSGIAIMPEMSCVPYADLQSLRCIPLTDSWARIQMDICVRDPDALSVAAKTLLRSITD